MTTGKRQTTKTSSAGNISAKEMLEALKELQEMAAKEEAEVKAAAAEQKRKENANKVMTFFLNNNSPLLDGDIVLGTVGQLPAVVDGQEIQDPSDGAGLRCRLAIKRQDFVSIGGKLKRSASRSGKAQLHGSMQGGRKITAIIDNSFFVEDLQDSSGEGVLLQGSILEILEAVPHAGGTPVKVNAEQIRIAAEKAKTKSREGLALWRQSLEPRVLITDEEDTFN